MRLASPKVLATVVAVVVLTAAPLAARDVRKVLGSTSTLDVPVRDFTVSGKSLVLQHRPSTAGQRVIVAALVPSSRRLSGEGFARYLRLEGVTDLADRDGREGKLPKDSVKIRSTKVARTQTQGTGSDSAAAVATVSRFRAALADGDSATALAMLSPDVIVLESGDVETREEYRRHHLPADIRFARAIPGIHTLVGAVVHGDAAWVSSTSVTKGRIDDRPINSAGAELIVLARRDRNAPWLIRAIHWSSHRRTS